MHQKQFTSNLKWALLGAGMQSGIQSSWPCPDTGIWTLVTEKLERQLQRPLKQEMANFLFLRSTFLKSDFVMSLSLFECWKWAKDSILVTQIQEVSLVLIFYGGAWSDLDGWLVEGWKAPHDWEPLSMDGCWRECFLGCNQMVSCTVSWWTESRTWRWALSG